MSSDETLNWQASIGNGVQQPNNQTVSTPHRLSKWASKTVLLIDSNVRSRESRAKVMRTLGVHVDCAATVDAARVRLAVGSYSLILVDLRPDVYSAEALVGEIRRRNSRQLVAFLVGSPLFVSTSLRGTRPARRTLAPQPAGSINEPSTPGVSYVDFGQAVRDAEAERQA